MKTILVIDSEMSYGKHLCCVEDEIKCPLWNNDKYICQYCLNTNTKGCPLKPMPPHLPSAEIMKAMSMQQGINLPRPPYTEDYQKGYNDCINVILGETE